MLSGPINGVRSRDLRSANLGEEYNESIFENFSADNSNAVSATSVSIAPQASIYYSKEAAQVALESERAIENKIIIRLETAIENYRHYMTPLTARRIEYLRDLLRLNRAPDDSKLSGASLFIMLPNLIREFPDKIYDFTQILDANSKLIILVGTEFEEAKMKQLYSGLNTSVEIQILRSEDLSALNGVGSDIEKITLVGIPKDDLFADRLREELSDVATEIQKKILPPNTSVFDLIGKSGQFAVILRVAWYAAISS